MNNKIDVAKIRAMRARYNLEMPRLIPEEKRVFVPAGMTRRDVVSGRIKNARRALDVLSNSIDMLEAVAEDEQMFCHRGELHDELVRNSLTPLFGLTARSRNAVRFVRADE